MTNFTLEDFVLYLYKETSPQQTIAIARALQNDWALREKLEVLTAAMKRLDKITVSPRTEVVLNVLAHAREEAEAV